MTKQAGVGIIHIEGQFVGWADDRIPHRRLRVATTGGEQIVKIAKSIRNLVQQWQPGMWLSLKGQHNRRKEVKIEQIIVPEASRCLTKVDLPQPVLVQVCRGKACRRKGADAICAAMAATIEQAGISGQVEIETVKCLDRCKAAPCLIVSPINERGKQEETLIHRQVTPTEAQQLVEEYLNPIEIPLSSDRQIDCAREVASPLIK
jgi:NADH:ubiquinone oxidoreductase subunit E